LKNYAFISYSHTDKKTVRKLHRAIEGFRIPRYVRQQIKNSPRRLYPIFRDETDLSGVALTPQLQEAIQNSDFLIVICSEGSARSEWVELEIDEFVNAHQVEDIIPIFLRAEDKAAFLSAFPSRLSFHGKEPSDSLLFGKPHQLVLFQIVTRLLRCCSDALLQRYQQQLRLRRKLIFGFLLFFLLFIGLDINWWYRNSADITHYYRDISYHNDWPEGVDRLYKWELDNVPSYYVCTMRNNRIRRSAYISNEATPHFPGDFLIQAPCMEFLYDDYYGTARVSRVVFRDTQDNILLVKEYSLTMDVIDLTTSLTDPTPYYLPESITEPTIPGTFACRVAPVYNSAGQLQTLWFLQDVGSAMVCDQNGYYALSYHYDVSGKVTLVEALDLQGQVIDRYRVSS